MLLVGTPSICGTPQRLGRKKMFTMTQTLKLHKTELSVAECRSNQLQAKCFLLFASFAQVRNGHVKRITDEDIGSAALEVCGNNVSTTTVTCPEQDRQTLGRPGHVVQ